MLTEEMLHAGNIAAKGFLASSELVAIYTAMHAARPTADLGEDGELVERLRDEATALERAAWSRPDGGQDGCIAANLATEAADRLILYREALEKIAAFPATGLYGSFRKTCVEIASAVLSRSGDD